MATLAIGGQTIRPGSRQTIELPLPHLAISRPLTLPVHVRRSRRDGPTLFVSAAIHGDELNGVEIIRRLLRRRVLERLRGTLIAVPIVNVYGVLHYSRYLPDRRDLNRSFPGHDGGSLAARLANLFMTEIVRHCTHGIDLHTGAIHRANLPQIRADLSDPETEQMAKQFGVPVLLDARIRDGSLRQAALEQGVRILLYEAGEALRFDEIAIRPGVQGVIQVMRSLGMLPGLKGPRKTPEPFVAHSSTWARAPASGVFQTTVRLGDHVGDDGQLGIITDPLGESQTVIRARYAGVVIGVTRLPLVHEGEALFHIARFEDAGAVADQVEAFRGNHEDLDTDAELVG